MINQASDNAISGPVRTDNGFSIIEMLIAIVVIVFGLASIVGISAYVSRTNSTSAALNVLAAAAQDQTDRLRTARWTRTYADPMLTIGGYVPAVVNRSPSEPPAEEPSIASLGQTHNAGLLTLLVAAPTPNPTPVGGSYTYTLDPDNPHHAIATDTAIGNLNINWQVRQGATPDLRYATIRVVQVNPPARLSDGVTVTTIIVRN